jgi:Glyoxalase-like domain
LSQRIDHVVYAVSDLEAGGARFEEDLGLESIPGGRHPNWGTANRIVPLGPDYLELVAVVDPETAASSDFGRLVRDTSEGLVGWAVATEDLDAVGARLGLGIERGTRKRPDGVRLAWRLAGVAEALRTGGTLPFFIQWEGPGELHPGGDHSAPAGIQWVEVAADEAELREWLGGAQLPVRFTSRAHAAEGGGSQRGITAAGIREIVLV